MPGREEALAAFARGDEDAAARLGAAAQEAPGDGALLIAEATALLRAGAERPFHRIEGVLARAPDWVEGHKALCRLKVEAGDGQPFASLEAAIAKAPKHPKLWMVYLGLLGAAGRHSDAARHARKLRREIADLPQLRLLEARHRGFAGEVVEAQRLLDDLPADLPERDYEYARNALRRNAPDDASAAIERQLARDLSDIGAWALAELAWRARGDARHDWLVPGDSLMVQCQLGLSEADLAQLASTLRALHTAHATPLRQSVEGSTQTHGDLRQRREPAIAALFEAIGEALRHYAASLPDIAADHPMHAIRENTPCITASWSIRLTAGGRHVPHLHDGGRVSSAAHIAVPTALAEAEGALELGRPPEDIPLALEPLARFAAKPGHLVLFPSFVYHATSPFAAGERLSVAFDAV
ncbi:putative 2OG-Fe(II) oxygenase [Erythrobacter sp.]|uniref:putative 2OG-Fe(II) oxygenase n=1 Tax=Erythrobacter sp. TaxID=1042 RepID=UPI002EC2662D|nr:putative 2OG-Fe(II) oxygenase [Erythrobacter sp.]